MSFRMQKIWNLKGVSDSELRVLQVMSWYHTEDPDNPKQSTFMNIYISNETLAIQIGIGLRQIIKITDSLIKKGFLINTKTNSKSKNNWMMFIEKIEHLHEETIAENTKLIQSQRSPQYEKYVRPKKQLIDNDKMNCSSLPVLEQKLSTGVNSEAQMSELENTHNSELENTLSLYNHYNNIYIYLVDKSNKKADISLLQTMKEKYGRTDKQLEDMINKVNSYNLDASLYNLVLNKLSFLIYMDKKDITVIDLELSRYIESKRAIKPQPTYFAPPIEQVRKDSLCDINLVRTEEQRAIARQAFNAMGLKPIQAQRTNMSF